MSQPFTVNVMPEPGFNGRPHGKEFTRGFKQQINAEIYIMNMCEFVDFRVTDFNFIEKYSMGELKTHIAKMERIAKEALRLEVQCRIRTEDNRLNPNSFPCEICGEKHENYKCCEKCNLDMHMCQYCGKNLGHREVGVCYIMREWED